MKYCPNCKRDFEDSVETCRWCELELVNQLPDEKTAIAEKLRRELMPTGEELREEQADFFAENADTVTVCTSFDPLQIRDMEKALQAAGIPVLVRPTPVGDLTEETDGEPVEEATEESAEDAKEEVAGEATEELTGEDGEESEEKEPEKKGFFARLFGKKSRKEEDADPIVAYRRPNVFAKMAKSTGVRSSDLLDIVVPAALEAEAVAVVNRLLGIYTETEITSYSDEELAAFDRETLGTALELDEDETVETVETVEEGTEE